jgi:hypothetical protein
MACEIINLQKERERRDNRRRALERELRLAEKALGKKLSEENFNWLLAVKRDLEQMERRQR